MVICGAPWVVVCAALAAPRRPASAPMRYENAAGACVADVQAVLVVLAEATEEREPE